ncbi:hypothetical protein [Paracoccus sp. SY]|uniref:hypothetical protein n=1 Tax=Paracoccus sp. SY TaxID=1330255 RepID=UPI00352BA1F9
MQDDIQEAVETAYLVVQVAGTGGFSFEDGSNYKTIEIRILDDNLTTGGSANDILRGTGAAEVLTGGAGNDTYHLTLGDTVVELAGGGVDTVNASFTHALAANVENLTLTGSAAINGTGNLLANRLTGNGAANQLVGGMGADTLLGMAATIPSWAGSTMTCWTEGSAMTGWMAVPGPIPCAVGRAMTSMSWTARRM